MRSCSAPLTRVLPNHCEPNTGGYITDWHVAQYFIFSRKVIVDTHNLTSLMGYTGLAAAT